MQHDSALSIKIQTFLRNRMRRHGQPNDWIPVHALLARHRFQANTAQELIDAIFACVGTGYQNRRRFDMFWAGWGQPNQTWVRLAPGNEVNREGE